jgi:hypothetical protein
MLHNSIHFYENILSFSANRAKASTAKKGKTVRKKTAAKKAKKGRKAKASSEDGTQDGDEDENEVNEQEEENDHVEGPHSGGLIELKNIIQPKLIHPHVRRLDPAVFSLMKYPLKISKVLVDFSVILHDLSNATQSTRVMNDVEKFSPEALAFILIEIQQHVTDNKEKVDVLSVNDYLASLCTHVETIAEWFKVIILNWSVLEKYFRKLSIQMFLFL